MLVAQGTRTGGARRLLASLVAALAAACAHKPPPLRSAELVVEHTRSGGLRPFLRARVAGRPVLLLVDTGASHSMLPARFARAANLPSRSHAGDPHIVDANGNLTRMPSLPDVPVHFEGESGAGTIDFLMNPSPEGDELVLAPHDLVRPGSALVIDLGRERLSYEPEDAARRRLGEEAPLQEIEFRTCLDEGFFNRFHRIVSTTINGVPAQMVIDTGAEHTVLARNNPALPSLVASEGAISRSAGLTSAREGLLVSDVPIEFAAVSFTMTVVVLPVSHKCWGGLLGADLLRHCTLVWGWSSLWAACRAPGAAP